MKVYFEEVVAVSFDGLQEARMELREDVLASSNLLVLLKYEHQVILKIGENVIDHLDEKLLRQDRFRPLRSIQRQQ